MNKNQFKAITSNKKNLLILAGAGSGKTRVLVYRIYWLIKNKNISPNSIMAVAFTNKAVNEIYERLKKIIKFNIKNIWIGTFHSLAYKMLYSYYKNKKNIQIIDKDDQINLIKDIIKKLNIDIKKYQPIKLQQYINKKKNDGLLPEDCNNNDNKLLNIYKIYQKKCNKYGFLDFGEILISTNNLLSKNPKILKKYIKQFKYILIDEFQDINTIQYIWINKIKNKKNNIMFIGDDDQSIYSWRGSNNKLIKKFLKDYKNIKIIKLEQNYRSTKNILIAANELIKNNNNRIKKKLWTKKNNGELISLYCANNELDEAIFVVNSLKIFKKNGGLLNNCAILYRNNIQSKIQEKVLIENNISYEFLNNISFFDKKEIKDIISYLKIILNRNDNISLLRIINTPKRKIGLKTINKINEISKKKNISIWISINNIIKKNILNNKIIIKLKKFIKLINKIEKNTLKLNIYKQIIYIIKEINLIESFKNEKNFKNKIKNLNELINFSKKFYIKNKKKPKILKLFLSNILFNNDNKNNKNKDSVKLMTLHSSKGLEFNQVFIIGMEEGIFPNKFILNNKLLEEERRLAYVGITRAKIKLTLSYSKIRYLYGKKIFNTPSRFIKEIPKKFIKKIENYNNIL